METRDNFIRAMLDAITAIDEFEQRQPPRLSTFPPILVNAEDADTLVE